MRVKMSSTGARPRVALALAAALTLLTCAASAQSVLFAREPSAERVEFMLESSGYELRGPLVRRGDVYIGDVVTETGDRARLVIDARTGHILERFRIGAERWREAHYGDWRERDDDGDGEWDAAPRPPRPLLHDANRDFQGDPWDAPAPPARRAAIDPTDRPAGDTKPNVIYGVNPPSAQTAAPDADPSKTKPRVTRKRKPAVASLAPASPIVDKVPVDAPKPSAEAKPAAEAKPTVENKPIAAPSPKPVLDTPKPVAEAKPVPEPKIASTPKAPPEKKEKPVNDVPVDPLD